MFQERVLLTLISAFAGGFIGFLFAYGMAVIHRRWDFDRARKESRQKHIAAARVPLDMIRAEIQSDYALQSYFNRDTELGVMRQISEAVFSLGDTSLQQALNRALRPLHEYAQTTLNPKPVGEKCLPNIEEILKSLDAMSH